jgi:hypothetical protein
MNKPVWQILFALLLLCIAASACTPSETPQSSTGVSSPVNLPSEITDQGAKMILIPAGTFIMGDSGDQALAECQKVRSDCQLDSFADEGPASTIDLPAFYMDAYEVTNALYKICVEAGTCLSSTTLNSSTHSKYYSDAQFDNFPVIYVDWDMALNGRKLRAGFRRALAPGATTLGARGLPKTGPTTIIPLAIPSLWAVTRMARVPMASTIWPAMCGSGRQAGITSTQATL